jgi:hypothetical protein
MLSKLRTRTSALAAALLVGAVGVAASAGPATAGQVRTAGSTPVTVIVPPQLDPFYTPPSPIPNVPPGTVVRSRQVVEHYLPGIGVPIPAWQVLYVSTDAHDQPDVVSGTVLVPSGPWNGSGPRPIVSYTTGTQGLAPECATSYELTLGTEFEENIFGQALLRGWAVALTDYQGRGVGKYEDYASGPSYGHAVLDMARAAEHLAGTGLSPAAPVGLWGYSEGGLAASWAADLHASYAPDVNVKSASIGGVPGDLNAMAKNLDGTLFSGILVLAAAGIAEAYPEVGIDGILNPAGRAAFSFAENTCVELTTPILTFQHLGNFTTIPDPLDYAPVKALLAANTPGTAHTPDVPVVIYNGTTDELVPFATAQGLAARYCQHGTSVTWRPMPFTEHIVGDVTGAPMAVSFLADRFNGSSAENDCWFL